MSMTNRRPGVGLRRALALLLAASGLVLFGQALAPSGLEAAGTNYFVDSANGNDGNSGTSESSPWRSLSPVQNRTLQSGDVVNLKRGSSWNGGLVIKGSGSNGNPITIQAYGAGARPTISNPGASNGSVIRIEGDYVVVQGLMLRDTQESGVNIRGGADNNVIRDNEMTAVGTGVWIRGQNNLITENYIHDLKMIKNTPGGDDDYGANGVIVSSSNNEVSYNRFVNCRADSADYGTDGGAVELYGNLSNIDVHHNYSAGGDGFVEVGGGSAKDVTVAYNISDSDYHAFAMMHLRGTFAATLNNFRVENNTIVKTTKEWKILNFNGDPTPSGFIFRNNIVYSQTDVANKSSFTHNNNLYHLYNGASLGFGLASGERQGDPLFVDLGARDYHLRPGSPAISAGVQLGYNLDFENKAIGAGAPADIGALASAGSPVVSGPQIVAMDPKGSFQLGFAVLADLLGGDAGQPVEDERHNPDNGDGLQQTTTGMMVWRKADNWTAFTNGTTTFVNGPLGLQSRPNDQRFDWEAQ